MSLIVFLETNTGLIIAGDSRLSKKVDPNWHRDDAEKVFNCKNIVGIAYHGDADINGEPIEKIIKDFIETVSDNDTYDMIFERIQKYIKSKGTPDTKFYIFGYDNSEKKIYQFNLLDNTIKNMSYSVHGTGGNDDIAWSILEGRFDIHKTNEEAILLLDYVYRKTMDCVDDVGGIIDILFISNNNEIKWLQHK